MLKAITLILLCQLIGESLVAASGLPVPGPVIGMVLLFLLFMLRGGVPKPIASVGDGLLNNLAVLFVPAGVGIMQHTARFGSEGLQLGATIVLSTLFTIAVTAWVMKVFMTGTAPEGEDAASDGR
ncbi:CidA/LrgA family protein [Fulvimarina endophytica]|uniref:CidA/LrgA family protein n=1 Tax=Fulvimarina endophytica TaxID=2293836 RepID=A0A371XA21_9HYPH|nr:CidA/LrgA family protein [Fulvimarina endophytica]RFC66070.1 CidA/LrgA family protein [Fulvimarina endophytica]